MTQSADDRDFGYWHRAASENLHQATTESDAAQAARFLRAALVSERRAYPKASNAMQRMLALGLISTTELILAHLDIGG